jgi:CheY-like chemotaxis protein/signal transduction histidine kinase
MIDRLVFPLFVVVLVFLFMAMLFFSSPVVVFSLHVITKIGFEALTNAISAFTVPAPVHADTSVAILDFLVKPWLRMSIVSEGFSYWPPLLYGLPALLLIGILWLGIRYREQKKTMKECMREIDLQDKRIRELTGEKESLSNTLHMKSLLVRELDCFLQEPLERLVTQARYLTHNHGDQKKTGRYRQNIEQNSRLLYDFMHDMLVLCQHKEPGLAINYKDFDLNQLLGEIYDFASREKAQQNKVRLSIEWDRSQPGEPFFIRSDPQRIRQILGALLRHSLKYAHQGSIRMGYRVREGSLDLMVEDPDPGLTSKEYEELFHFFRRGGFSSTSITADPGIELVLAGEIVQRMEGSIRAESLRNGATRFMVSLPFAYLSGNNHKKHNATRSVTHSDYDWSDRKILVVEDSRMAFDLIAKLFKDSGAEFVLEPDGTKAVTRCRQDPSVDLVLMDIQLPVMDGYEATRQIKHHRPDLPVIAQTANALSDDRKKALDAGCDEYIAKPIDKEEMGEKVDRFLSTGH